MNFEKYENVLEYVPLIRTPINDNIIDDDSSVYNCLLKRYASSKEEKYLISLSGGVDSMVLISILNNMNKRVVGIHINYNNRKETYEEKQFLIEWCEYNNIKLYTHDILEIQRMNTKRKEYESLTKKIRFDLYKKIMKEENGKSVMLAHHKDDMLENIFTNICRARSLFDLGKLQEESIIDDVVIERPMLKLGKDEILRFAHRHNIPYFKNTTPEWSIRGIYRNDIYPLLEHTFGTTIKTNLFQIESELKDWFSLIDSKIMDPFWETVEYSNNGIRVDIQNYKDFPFCFWNAVFIKVFHSFNMKAPSKKSIMAFMKYIQTRNDGNIELTSRVSTTLTDGTLRIQIILVV